MKRSFIAGLLSAAGLLGCAAPAADELATSLDMLSDAGNAQVSAWLRAHGCVPDVRYNDPELDRVTEVSAYWYPMCSQHADLSTWPLMDPSFDRYGVTRLEEISSFSVLVGGASGAQASAYVSRSGLADVPAQSWHPRWYQYYRSFFDADGNFIRANREPIADASRDCDGDWWYSTAAIQRVSGDLYMHRECVTQLNSLGNICSIETPIHYRRSIGGMMPQGTRARGPASLPSGSAQPAPLSARTRHGEDEDTLCGLRPSTQIHAGAE